MVGVWIFWHGIIRNVMSAGFLPSWLVAWPSWLVAVLSATVLAAIEVVSARPFEDRHKALRVAPYWTVGGLFAWVMWTLLAEGLVPVEQITRVLVIGIASASFFAGGLVAAYRESIEAIVGERILLAGLFRVLLFLSLTCFFFYSLLVVFGSKPNSSFLVIWIGSGLGPLVAIGLLKRWFAAAPLAASQQTVTGNNQVTAPSQAAPAGGRSILSARKLVTAVAVIAGVHGYIWLLTEEVHPCKAAEVRLIREQGLTLFSVGIEALGSQITGKEYEPKTAEERKLMQKLKSLEPFGVFGCYLPAMLGWKAVPPL
jgi:hypothetical protein